MPPSHKVHKPKTVDVAVDTLARFDILQPKEDGWYVECVSPNDGWLYLFSSTSTLIAKIPFCTDIENMPPLCGEYIFGTNRAKTMMVEYYETVRLFDIQPSSAPLTYRQRYSYLQALIAHYHGWCQREHKEPRLFLVPALNPLESLSYLMDEVIAGRTEGVIGRMWDTGPGQKVHRHKPRVTVDYILLRLVPGSGKYEGATGSFMGGAYNEDGELVEVCKVSGMSDALRFDTWAYPERYLGRVFEAEGAQKFTSGALRHPRFKRWREDVLPEQVHKEQEARYVR